MKQTPCPAHQRGDGTGVLKVDGKVVATKKMQKTIPLILQWDESLDVGSANRLELERA